MQFSPFDIGDGASLLAAGAAIAALWFTRQSARSAKSSAEQARRSADASEASAEAARRSAKADETMARLAEEEANRYRVPWVIEHDRKFRYRLIHDNDTETALDLSIEGEAVHPTGSPRKSLGPQENTVFLLTPLMGQSREVTIRWRRPTDPEGELRTHTTYPPPAN